MSEEQPEVPVKRRTFTPEFKADAVHLVTDEKYTFQAAAKALGEQSLRQWHAKLAPKPLPCGEDATLDELREENKRLRRCGPQRLGSGKPR